MELRYHAVSLSMMAVLMLQVFWVRRAEISHRTEMRKVAVLLVLM